MTQGHHTLHHSVSAPTDLPCKVSKADLIEIRRENGNNVRPKTVHISNFIWKLREFEAVINDLERIIRWRLIDAKQCLTEIV